MAAGIGLVPEDRRQQGLVMDFSIERNIALASLDSVRRGGLIPRGAERRFAKDWALRLQLKYGKLTNPVWTLSGGNQQKAVLAKWLARKPTLLIVDEPTRGIDVGTKAEVHRLLSELAAQGVAVLMISSELPEVLGMAVDALFPKVPTEPGRVVLKVDRLTREGVFTDVSFEVRRGEIVALAGLVGAGRTRGRARDLRDRPLGRGLGRDRRHGRCRPGRRRRRWRPASGSSPRTGASRGSCMDFSIERNIALASLDSVRRGGLIPRGAERRFAKDWALRLQLKYGRLTNPVWTLSGGNQQKAVLAKWLARKPTLLIVDEPTRGIDVGTKAEVHRLLSELAAQGVAVLMISSELPGGARHGRPHRRALRGPRDARVRAGRGRRGRDHARGHRASSRSAA